MAVYYNNRMMYLGTNTFPGSTWSWDDFLSKLSAANIYKYPKTSYTFIQDFENHIYYLPEPDTRECVHSRSVATYFDSTNRINCRYSWRLEDILVRPVRHADVEVWINPVKTDTTGAFLAYSVEDESNVSHFSGTIRFDDFHTRAGQWNRIRKQISIPGRIDQYCTIHFSINDPGKTRFFVDDLKIIFN